MRTLKNTKRGSIGCCLLIIVAIVGACFYYFGSERIFAALSVFKGKTESAIVAGAGKAEVAEELALRRLEDLRQKLVNLKSLKRSLKRAAENPNIPAASKARYDEILARLDISEKKATDAYNNASAKFEELRAQLAVSEAEAAIIKASASAIEDSKSANHRRARDIDKVINSINKDLDDANAELDVSIMESNEQ